MLDLRAKILWWAAKRRVHLDQPYVIAVTGSIAKTSTKVAIGAVLRRANPNQVRVGYGNLNSFLGVPLAILGFKVDFYRQNISWQWLPILITAKWRGLFGRLPKYLVLEYGADNPGDIEALAKQLPLDGAVVTLVGPAHLANYPSVEAIAQEKAQIFKALKSTGWAIINKDDPYSHKMLPKNCQTEMVATETEDIAVNFARRVGQLLKIDSATIEEALTTLPRPEGRLQLKDLGRIKLLDDSYNANPLSMTAALNVLGRLPAPRVAILGDMLELGSDETKYHQEIGRLAHSKASIIIGVGQLAKSYNGTHWFPDAVVAAREVLTLIPEGASVLVKGSHGIHLETVVKTLTNHYKNK